jgi:putative RecB family exonuclease
MEQEPGSGGVTHALAPPHTLSPSSMGTFTSCPLAFRFSYLERLPEAPTPPACKGTLVHLALQHLMWRPAAERTLDGALDELGRARAELEADAEFAQLELTDDEWSEFHADAETLVRRYFEIEDPRTVRVLGVELRVTATTDDGVTIRGIIDRLELDADGELVVTDYKTGSAPNEGWEQKSMAGVHVYSLLCERMFGRRPSRVQLLYLSTPEKIVTRATEQSLRGVELKSNAVMRAIRIACGRHDFRPRASALCAFCSFREFCPEFGGEPSQAAPVLLARQADREGRPQLPFATV